MKTGLCRIPLPSYLDLKVVIVPYELSSNVLRFAGFLVVVVHETKADVAFQREAISWRGRFAHEAAVPVDGFAAPGPDLGFWVVVLNLEMDQASFQALVQLLLEGFLAEEVVFLVVGRGVKLVYKVVHKAIWETKLFNSF